MALDEGDIIDEETGVPTTTATPPRPGATPGGSGPTPGPGPGPTPGPTPIPVAPTPTARTGSPLDRVMSAYNEKWVGRMRNIGAGGGLMTGAAAILTGGALGSYSPTTRGSIEKAIDAMNKERTGIDYNATARVSNIWRKADDQIASLSGKIRLCDEMEATIENFIANNKTLVGTAMAVKATPARAIKPVRSETATMWEKIKEHRLSQDTVRVTKHLGIGMGSVLTAGAILGLSPLAAVVVLGGLPVGVAMAIRKVKQDPDGTARSGKRKELEEARSIIMTIRRDAEEKRGELLKGLELKHKEEVAKQKSVNVYFQETIKPLVSSDDAKKILFEFGKLMQTIDPTSAISGFMGMLKGVKKPDTTPAKDAFEPNTLVIIEQSLAGAFSKKCIDYRLSVNKSLGLLEAAGPEQIGALLKSISQANALVPQWGREIELTTDGVTKKYIIKSVSPGGDINLEEITTPKPKDDVCIKVAKDGDVIQVVSEVYDVPTETFINEVKNKKYDDLIGGAEEEFKKQKKLLDDAKNKRLTIPQYIELWKALKVPPADYEKNSLPFLHGIATHSRDTFETKRVDKQSTEDLIDELKTKKESDLLRTGTPDEVRKRKKLLADAQTKRLTVAEYKQLWAALDPTPPEDLPFIAQIAVNPDLANKKVPVNKDSDEDLMEEISVKEINDLIDGTPAEVDRYQQLLENAQMGRLTVGEYKELWNALKPPPHWARNNLPRIQAIAESPSTTFVQVMDYQIPKEVLVAEMRTKTEHDLHVSISELPRMKQLLFAAQDRRISGENYRKLYDALKDPSPRGQAGLRFLEEIAKQSGTTFEQVEVDKISETALLDEIASKNYDDLMEGTPAEVAERIQLLDDAQAGKLTVPQYKKLWKALKPVALGQAGLTEIKKIATGTETKFKLKKTPLTSTDIVKVTL